MATLHLMVGLPCSGKTTEAKLLEKEYNALLLTTDKCHIKLFGNIIGIDHDKKHENVEEILWEIAKRVLTLGVDVILDFGFWGKMERLYFKKMAKDLDVKFKIHFMDVSKDELYKRLEKRNMEQSEEAFIIPIENMDKYIEMFQIVEQEELEEGIDDKLIGRWHNYYM